MKMENGKLCITSVPTRIWASPPVEYFILVYRLMIEISVENKLQWGSARRELFIYFHRRLEVLMLLDAWKLVASGNGFFCNAFKSSVYFGSFVSAEGWILSSFVVLFRDFSYKMGHWTVVAKALDNKVEILVWIIIMLLDAFLSSGVPRFTTRPNGCSMEIRA